MKAVYDERERLWVREESKDLEVAREVRTAYRALPVRAGDICLDLGGHIGTAARLLVEKGAACVYSVEPDPDNFSLLQRNTEGLPVVAFAGAVAPVPGIVTLYLNATGCYSYHRTVLGTSRRKAIPVAGVTLEAMLAAWTPTVIKCDVEFAEHDLLELRALPPYVRALQIEVHFRYGNTESQARLHASGEALLQSFVEQGFRPVVAPKIGPNVWRTNSTWERVTTRTPARRVA